MRRILVPSAVVAGVLAVLLVGCTPDADPSDAPSRSRTPSASPTPSGTPEPSPSGSAPASSDASPVAIPCADVVSNQTVYDFNPIYSSTSPVAPAAGSSAAQVLADRGTVCEWVNTSSGTTIDVAIGKYSAAGIDRIRSTTFTGGGSASGWGGDAGYFSSSGGFGTAAAIVGSYWVTARSQEFAAAADADPFMTSAVAAAKAAG